ncbi:hypothetical protein BDD43_3272 [Mucilaginibacter gracilis]|uniref:YD repeat-containing protein n=1 Tax=Mucilaginibacter gracilis TaxID=423350 RepID=A0A495J315_9SPHI|nr:hypothetical protein [Mucilaginibacter gracilis]RKR83071.1 hypothetical protein BDD43_3272 [Mucilaginibacter gracilis]
MKKCSIICLLLLTALLQFCKKSGDSTDSTTTAVLFQAYVNSSVWTPTSTKVTLTYNATAKTKTFSFEADSTKDQILMTIKQPASALDSTFTAQNYIADTTATSNVTLAYNKLVNNVYTPVGTLKAGSINISSIDVSKKLVTGTFVFNETKYNYDSNGNIVSLTSTVISSGEFNNLPYTFKRQ